MMNRWEDILAGMVPKPSLRQYHQRTQGIGMTFKDHEGYQRVPRVVPQEAMSAPIEREQEEPESDSLLPERSSNEGTYLSRLTGMMREPNPYKRFLNVLSFMVCLAFGLFIIMRSISPAVLDGGVQQAADLIDAAEKKTTAP